jgi:Domain of unknown function (DUF4189)
MAHSKFFKNIFYNQSGKIRQQTLADNRSTIEMPSRGGDTGSPPAGGAKYLRQLDMLRNLTISLALSVPLVANAPAAMAAYGAFAYDGDAHKYGYSWNQDTERRADEAAIKGCKTDKCKVVFRTGPKECGAIALTPDNKVWGGAKRDTRPAAELAAIENCQKRTSSQCKVQASECNR